MMSMYRHSPAEENVLDLCVRKAEKRCASPAAFPIYPEIKRSKSASPTEANFNYYANNQELEPRKQQHYTTDYNATVKVLQQRIYHDGSSSPQKSPSHGTTASGECSTPYIPTPSPVHYLPHQVTTTSATLKGKATRPFKAYPKNPLSLSMTVDGHVSDSSQDYAEFRRQMMDQVRAATGNTTNKNMKRPVNSSSPDTNAPSSSSVDTHRDSAYWDRRRKNNEAAKRSRDARRAKEDELAIRAAFLEQENVKLKYELAAMAGKLKYEVSTLSDENDRLRRMLYSQCRD